MTAANSYVAKGRLFICLFVFAIWTLFLCCFMCIATFEMRCALGCERNDKTPLHRFPNPDKFPEQFKAWVSVMGEKLENPEDYLQYKHKRICDIHFKMEDRNRNNRLNALAVPSLHLPMWCNVPAVATTSSVAQSNVKSTSETVECAGPSSTTPVLKALDDDKCRREYSEGIVECVGPSNTTPVLKASDDDKCRREYSERIGSIDEQSTVDAAFSSVTAAISINDDHNYCLKPGLVQVVNIAGQPAGPVPAASSIRDEHNYFMNSSGLVQRGRRTHKTIPTHLLNQLKTNVRQIKNLKREINRLRKRGLDFKARLENAQKISDNVAFQKITKNMSNPAKMFTRMQYREGLKKPKGRRFTIEEKILSLSIFKRSAKCYSFLARQFALPSKSSLKTLLSTVHLKAGINTIVFEKMKKTVAAMNNDKKVCTVIFDEMSINPQVHFDSSKDELKGFTSSGQKIADHVLVFMVKGIKANFKQPVAYYFTNSLNKNELKSTLTEVIKHVQATGLQVMCTVCDQSTVNVSTINSLVDETKAEYMRRRRDFRFTHFKVNDKIIIPLYDVPHLLKGVRNNLLNKDLVYIDDTNGPKKIKWEYFEKVFEADKSYGELRVAYKLTEEHINKEKIKKMRVKTAAQLFSHSVAVATEHYCARGDLQPECRDLVPLVLLLDQLFDSLNGNTFHIPHGKIYKGSVKRNSPHHVLWEKAIKILKTVKFITKKNSAGEVRFVESTAPSIVNFIKTIEGVQNLWKILNEKYSFDTLLTRNLNQDPVENFFGNIRSYGVRNVGPNCVAFEGAYKALLLNNFNSPHSIQANCEEDKNDCLQSLDFFLTEKPSSTICDKENEEFAFNEEILMPSGENDSNTDKGQRSYVCGWVLRKCYKNITKSCTICKNDLSQTKDIETNSLITAKEYNKKKKWLCYPSRNLEGIFQEIQRITCIYLKKDVPKYGLKSNVRMMCDTLIDYQFKCQIHKDRLKAYFVDITIKVLIYSWCRSINRILKGKISYNADDDELKLAAHVYYMKHKHNKNVK